jgi:tetratricopeptide (TPR) repeat protein
MSGDYNNALINYNRSISLDKTNPYPYNSKGALYYQFLSVDSLAILNFNKALSLDKTNILALYNIRIYAKYQEEYKEAIKYLTKAIKLNKEFQKAYEARACCYYYLNKTKKAIKGFKKALKYNTIKDPFDKLNDIEMYKWLSKCYYKINNNKMGYYYFKLTET